MKILVLILTLGLAACNQAPAVHAPEGPEVAAWKTRADGVTIIRDDWGVPHIYAKTDADVVFGLMYAQAEDDFNRVETNFINSQGRLAEAEGEGQIFRDLRMKLFIDPADMKKQYDDSPQWLKALMDAWADGLNFYLATHPDVQPRVITKFEPWMALSFSEGSIGGDIERVNLTALEAFYGAPPVASSLPAVARSAKVGDALSAGSAPLEDGDAEPRGSNGIAIAGSNTASGK